MKYDLNMIHDASVHEAKGDEDQELLQHLNPDDTDEEYYL